LLYPEAGPSGAYEPLERGARPTPLPPASRLEALSEDPFVPPLPTSQAPPAHLEVLRRHGECPFRTYLERFPLRAEDGALGWHLFPDRMDELAQHPEVGPWLILHQEHLRDMVFWALWPGERFALRLDGVRREAGGRVVHLYRLLPPGKDPDLGPQRRWTEWYALGAFLQRKEVEEVHLWTWPFLGKPRPYRKKPFRKGEKPPQLEEVRWQVEKALTRWREGVFSPKPGSHCWACGLEDICRKEEA